MLRIAWWCLFLPLQTVLLFLFALLDLLHLVRIKIIGYSKIDQKNLREPTPLCSIIVLNWNGLDLLQQSLPALEKAIQFTGQNHEVIVVDNGSNDTSMEWLEQAFPQFRRLTLGKNLGFGEGNNRGVNEAHHNIVVLLNNDTIVTEDFLPPLLSAFSDPQTFAVSSQIFFPEKKIREETGNTKGNFQWGHLDLSHQPIRQYHYKRKYLPILWAGGGSSAFDRHRFLQLGGFSSLFSPCYFEDTDLSYRAWRRGWKILLAAESRVLHKHRSSTSKRFSKRQINRLIEERKFWYVCKNFSFLQLIPYFIFLPLNFGVRELSPKIYLRALRKIHSVFSSRFSEPVRIISDRQLFEWIWHPITFLNHFRSHSQRDPRLPLRILIVSAYLPHLGYHGGATRAFQFLSSISKTHKVSVISFIESQTEATKTNQLTSHCERVETVLREKFQPVSPFTYEPFEKFRTSLFREKLEELLTEQDFDLVHFEWAQMAQYADLLPHTPKILTVVEVGYAAKLTYLRLQRNPLRKVHTIYKCLQTFYREIEMCRKVDRVVCVTNKDLRYLKGYVKNSKLSVINTGVDTSYYTNNTSGNPSSDVIVFVGAFRHQPNVDAMLYFCSNIFPHILNAKPHTHFYIIGSSPPRSIQELSRHSKITVTGHIHDIRNFYDRASLVVVPLRLGVGIRGKILEAWATGKAVVATSLSCFGLRAVHGKNILIADDPGVFSLQVIALLKDPNLCHRLGLAGRKTAVQYYDCNLLGAKMKKLYESITTRNQRAYEKITGVLKK